MSDYDVIPVDQLPADTPLEETATSVTSKYPVVLPAGRIAAHDTHEPRGRALARPWSGRGVGPLGYRNDDPGGMGDQVGNLQGRGTGGETRRGV
ncbi:hypothetical protein DPMN_056084 [Dreissena polymorpha]|uniref:Uncharacterized protein n=1 Tax=Dreissena polymorpha TaxID=45954 RepID=A0A9D4HSU9_DREPO|nr:hypothetical protein DPMN_056084 [Dreissena polymorpha]